MNENLVNINKQIMEIKGYDENIFKYQTIKLEETRSKDRTIKYPSIDGKEIYVHSKYNIENEVEKAISHIDFSKNGLYIVYGLGLGYHIDILKRKITPKSTIFVIEKNMDIVSTYINNFEILNTANGKIEFFFGNEDEILRRLYKKLRSSGIMTLIGNMQAIELQSYKYIYGDWSKLIQSKTNEFLRQNFFELGNCMEDTLIGIKNNFINIGELIKSPSLENFKDKYKQKPGIIVSAGPSLDKNIKELKGAQGKALIIATDATLTALKNNGIVPDAVVSIERVKILYEKFYEDKNIDENIVLIAPPVLVKEIFDQMKSNKKIVGLKKGEGINEWMQDNILDKNQLLDMGTSCAHIAFSFLRYVGCDPVVFIGQDLAYTKEGITHAEEVEVKDSVDVKSKSNIYEVESINGDKLPTNYAMRNFLTWFETSILSDDSIEYLDCTEGGALIRGTKIMTLKDMIDTYCKEDIKPLHMITYGEENDEAKQAKAIRSLKDLKSVNFTLKEAVSSQVRRLDSIEKVVNERGEYISKELLERLERIYKNTDSIYDIVSGNMVLLTLYQHVIVYNSYRLNKISYENTKENILKKIDIHQRLASCIMIGSHALDTTIDEVIKYL